MAAAELIPTGSSTANSADITVTDGSSLTVGLKGLTDSQARVIIYIKDDGGGYNAIGELSSFSTVVVLAAPGVYRVSRIAGAICGVYSA